MLDVLLEYEFLRNAFWAGMIIGIVSPVVGVFLVVRRLSLMADALSHIALSGVAAGMLLREVSPAFAFLTPFMPAWPFPSQAPYLWNNCASCTGRMRNWLSRSRCRLAWPSGLCSSALPTGLTVTCLATCSAACCCCDAV